MCRTGGHSCCSRDQNRLDRTRPLCRGAIAQLAVGIISPRPHGSVVLRRDTMILARTDADDSAQTSTCSNGCQLVNSRAIAEFALVIVSPTPDGSVVLQSEAVIVAAGNFGEAAGY